jgi:hypothetical protein
MQQTKAFAVPGLIALLVAVIIQLAWIPIANAVPPGGSYIEPIANAVLPGGSYTQTCDGSYTRGGTLFSTCANPNNQYADTSLKKYNLCRGDISNYQGRLRCGFKNEVFPAGSYTLSCSDIFEDEGADLLALCRMARGGGWSKFARLKNYKECSKGSIDNIDGILTCDRPSS